MIKPHNKVTPIRPSLPKENLSTIAEEMEAIQWELSELMRAISLLPASGVDEATLEHLRWRISNAYQRSHRAHLISQGTKVMRPG